MFFQTAIFTAFAAAAGVMGAAVPEHSGAAEVSILIATDAFFACNKPNNGGHTQGSSCKYLAGPSSGDDSISGTCEYPNGNHLASLECIA